MGCEKVGPVTDKAIYDMAKAFAERIGKGEMKQNTDQKRLKTQHQILIES